MSTFGFLRTAVYADGDNVAHAQLDWPEGGGIMLGSSRARTHASGRARARDTSVRTWSTDRVDELYARVQAGGRRSPAS